MMELSGKVVLITGGASGIGFEIVQELLRTDVKGVSIVDISEQAGLLAVDDLSRSFDKARFAFVKADVGSDSGLRSTTSRKTGRSSITRDVCRAISQPLRAFEQTIATFKNLDIVVNNAGLVDEHNWERSVNILLLAVLRGTHLAMEEYFPKHRSGREGLVVNTASIFGLDPSQEYPAYSGAKAAVVAFGQSIGSPDYFGRFQTNIVTVCPGYIDTPLLQTAAEKSLFPDKARAAGQAIKDELQSPALVAQRYVEVMRKAANGSVWVIENHEVEYEVQGVGRRNMKKSS